jgi:hypothetical protein
MTHMVAFLSEQVHTRASAASQFSFFVVFSAVLWFAKQMLYLLSHVFSLVIFQKGSRVFAWGWTP